MNQKERILSILKRDGCITAMDAMKQLGCMRLAARILDLKKDGHCIRSLDAKSTNRWGDSVRFSVYYIHGHRPENRMLTSSMTVAENRVKAIEFGGPQ